MCDDLFSTWGLETFLQIVHRRKVHFSKPVSSDFALWRLDHFGCDKAGKAFELVFNHRFMFVMIDLLKQALVQGTRINHNYFYSGHFP